MWQRTVLIGAGALAALVVAAGCSNSGDSGGQATSNSTPSNATAAATTTVPPAEAHNDADVMFAQHMIPHHQQAVEMSDMLLAKQGVDPRVTQLANQIKAAQGPEIEQMQGWLKKWGSPAMPPMPSASMPMPSGDMTMPGHGDMPMPSASMPMPSASMPMPSGSMPGMSSGQGMMSEQDMTALQIAQGIEASKLFLTQMIQHHEGAITMAQTEIKDGQYPPAVEMARSIVTSQQQEIDTMKGMLASL